MDMPEQKTPGEPDGVPPLPPDEVPREPVTKPSQPPMEAPLPSTPPEMPAATPSERTTPRTDEPASAPAATTAAPAAAPAPQELPAPMPAPPAPKPAPPAKRPPLAERPEVAIEVPRTRLTAQTRRDFLLYTVGVAAAAAGTWWLLPQRTKARLLPPGAHDALDTLAARTGLTEARRGKLLERSLTFDDDVAEALYSKDRSIRTYDKSEVTPLRNNYDGQTPSPAYLPTWQLQVTGLASGRIERFAIGDLTSRFAVHEQVTRFVCVEGWSAVAWWGGIRFADLLAAFPPAPGAKWAALRSSINLDAHGHPDPYYVSIDLETARHPQTLLATQLGGKPLPIEHGAPMRLLAPMKLGLKNIKGVTEIAYTAKEPADYWNERGYSKYDGL